MIKSCRKCGDLLVVGKNWKPSSEKRHDYICRSCRRPQSVQEKLIIKEATIEEYGGKCTCCGETNLVFLTIDHIDETGAQEREAFNIGGGHQFYHWLKRKGYPKGNYQVLCFNCNYAKHVLGKCPHQHKTIE